MSGGGGDGLIIITYNAISALVPGSFAVSSPQFTPATPGLRSNNFTAPDLTIVAPGIGVGAYGTLVRAGSLTVGSPEIGSSLYYPMMPVLQTPVSAVAPTPYTTKLFYGDLTHSFIEIGNPTGTKPGIFWFESSGVLYHDIGVPPVGLTFHSGDYIEYGPTTTITSYIWGNVGGAWYYYRGVDSTFYPWNVGPTPQPTNGPAIPGAADDLLIGSLQIDVALVAQPINGVAPSPLGQWLSTGDTSHSLVTPSGIWSIDAAGVVWFNNQAINPSGPYLERYDVVQYAPTSNGETSNIWVTIAGAWLYFDVATAQFYTPNSGPLPQATNQPQWALTPPSLTVGSPSLAVLFMAPLSPNGVVLVGQNYTIVAADGTQAGLVGNEVYVNGADSGFSVDGGIEIVNGLLYAWNASTNSWFIYHVGVWRAVTPPPARILATSALTVGSPVFDGQAMAQLHPMPVVGITVGSPVFGGVFTSATPLGGAIYAPTGGALITGTGTLWTFGLSPPGDVNNKYVLRNGANPYGQPLPGYEIVTDTSGVVWVKAYNGQWYYDSGTAMVPWPAPPKMAMAATGFAVGRPAVGVPLPVVTWFNVYGFSVGSPQIGVPSFIGVTPMPTPLGIWIGPSSIGVAWPTAHEVNHLKAIDLVPWFPDVGTSPLAVALAGNEIGTTDPIIRPLDQHTGSVLLYRSASGLERAMADVDGFRLTATYAELIKDQWDPNAISYENLPYLAYAMGVNLWEANWSEAFRRYWVANQWTLKQIRGSLYGITTYVAAVGGTVKSAIVPPAKFFPGPSYTAAQRAAYVARFPQLRLYPYVARVELPYICCCSKFISGLEPNEKRTFNKNGCFTGPKWKFYPTAQDAGGRYTRTAVIYDPATGVETPLTYRTTTTVTLAGEVQTIAEITVPAKAPNTWFLGDSNRYPLPAGHPPRTAQNQHSIFLGSDLSVAARTIEIVVPMTSSIGYSKAIYQTISWGNEKPIDLYPDTINETHTFSKYGLACGVPRGTGRIYLMGGSVGTSYLVRSVAWQFTYMVWYLFDPSRVPDYRKASVYMGHAQFGQHRYTAKIRIDVGEVWRPWYFSGTTFIRGFWHPRDNRRIEAVRRAVTAAMAERDTVGIDTAIKRIISTNDSLPCDGTFTVGEWIDARVI
jgi:phage tail P2-like protein